MMFRKLLFVSLVLVLGIGAAEAASQPYFASVMNSGNVGTNVYNRDYNPGFATVTPSSGNCASSATIVGFDSATRSCQLKFNTANQGYRGSNNDIQGDLGTDGQLHYVVFDWEQNAGLANHAGFYFWAARTVTTGETAQWFTAGCSGTLTQTCIGQGTTATSNGMDVANTPLGDILPVGGFRPMPVPIVGSADKITGAINLTWRDASALGVGGQPPSYRLVGIAKDSCTAPFASEFGAGHVYADNPGLSFTANTNNFGFAPTVPKCYYFALQLVFPPALSTPVVSRYFSANSAGVVMGGLATTFSSIKVSPFKNGVDVTWTTSLEDGTRGFYVTRAAGAGQPFERVSPLIQANGQPSTYHYLDVTVGAAARNRALWRIEALDADDNASASDAVPMTRK